MLLYFFTFACNDVAGCPIPSLLDPRSFSWEQLKAETGWPGFSGLGSWETTGFVLCYYLLSMILWRFLPAGDSYGTKLVQHGKPLKYRFNGENAVPLRCGPN